MGYQGYKVVAVTPAGRRRYMEILTRYTDRDRDIIDRHDLWLNTTNPDDIAYMKSLESADPFFHTVPAKTRVKENDSIHHFFRDCINEETIYVRFDDDICWVAPDALRKLLDHRLKNPLPFIVYANTVNNPIMSHLHQRFGILRAAEVGFMGYTYCCPIAYKAPKVAARIHEEFLLRQAEGGLRSYEFDSWELSLYERVAINCLAFFGSDMAVFGGAVEKHEENFLSTAKPKQLRRPNVICGQSLVVHFAYKTQRQYLEEETNLLERYRRLSEKI